MSNQQLYNQHRNNGVPHDEAAAALGVSQDAARMLKSRFNKSNTPKSELDAAINTYNKEVELTKLAYKANAAKRPHLPQVETKSKSRTKWRMPKIDWQEARNYGVSILLVAVVIGHAGLVWFDCSDRWGLPGAIGGGVVFLIVLAALLLASDETKPRTSEAALWFVFCTDVAAWFVHFPVFRDRAQIGSIETGVFAGFLCAASFTALYLYRDLKLD